MIAILACWCYTSASKLMIRDEGMYSIKEVSKKFEVSYDTLRYYEKENLLTNVQRDNNNRRIYSDINLDELSKVVHLRQLGATISEIKRMMQLFNEKIDVDSYDEGIAFLKRLNEGLNQKIASIESQKAFLHEKITRFTNERNKLDGM